MLTRLMAGKLGKARDTIKCEECGCIGWCPLSCKSGLKEHQERREAMERLMREQIENFPEYKEVEA